MVKLLFTPFGEYGYVMTGANTVANPVQLHASHGRPPHQPNPKQHQQTYRRHVGATAYDARYLKTTDLAVGSQVMRMRDPESYMKRGLLHKGQEPMEPLPFQLPPNLRSASERELPRQSRAASEQASRQRLPSVVHNCKVLQKWRETHAGTSTFPQRKPGFAKRFAESRSSLGSLAKTLGSGEVQGSDLKEQEEGNERKEGAEDPKKIELPELLKLEQDEMPFSILGRLKSQRLNMAYTDMPKKHKEHRLKLIMDKVVAAQKIKEQMHRFEMDRRRKILQTSVASQRSQLRQLRSRHRNEFESRINSLYAEEPAPTSLELPRETYGLPEDEEEIPTSSRRGGNALPSHPGKISLQSFQKADHITSKFNNVWNVLNSPRRPQTIDAAAV